jgi:hypothetical protein
MGRVEADAHGLLTERADTGRNSPGRLPVGITHDSSPWADSGRLSISWNGAQMTHNPEECLATAPPPRHGNEAVSPRTGLILLAELGTISASHGGVSSVTANGGSSRR